jgi:hypothetical protein
MTNINDFDTSNKTSEVKVEIKNAPEKPISQPVMEEMVFKKIAETLGLEDFVEMEKYKDEIEIIAQYAKKMGTEDIMDFGWFVKNIESKIGTPELGEKRVTKLARYIYLLNEKGRVEKEIRNQNKEKLITSNLVVYK